MATDSVHFFSEHSSFSLKNTSAHTEWIISICSAFQFKPVNICYIFCSDEQLLEINKQYLSHDFYTDIITFDNSDVAGELTADIFISVDRVRENAANHNIDFMEELQRVMAHGLLHLFGYGDKTEEEADIMRKKEDACLSLRQF